MKLQNRLAGAIVVFGLCLVFSSQLQVFGQNLLTTIQPVSQSGTWTVQPGNTANTIAWKVDGSAVTQPVSLGANQSVNVALINGVTPLMGAGATGTGATRVNDVASSATGAAPPASATYIAGLCSGATGGFLCGPSIGDTDANINVSTATTTLIVTGVASRKIHVTSLRLGPFPSAQTLAWIEGTGATCGTGTAGVEGGTTAAAGVSYPANGGERQGTGIGDVLATATAGDSLCLVTGSAVQTSGHAKVTIY